MGKLRNAPCNASAAVAVAAVAVGLSLVAAAPAAASHLGLERTGGFSDLSTGSPKSVTAYCSEGKLAVGGGALIYEPNAEKRVRLTELHPIASLEDPLRGAFEVTAEAPSNFSSNAWKLAAYAVCMNSSSLDRYKLIYHTEDPSSKTFQTSKTALCPSGTVAYGAGGGVYPDPYGSGSPGRLGLQMVRTDGAIGIGRATAREDEVGYGGTWRLFSAAICAEPAGAIHVEGTTPSDPLATEASHRCGSSGDWGRGIGGGGGLTDGGPVFLRELFPLTDGTGVPNGVRVKLTGSLYPSVGGIAAHHTCALGF